MGHPRLAIRSVEIVLASMVVFDKSGCIVLYCFEMFNLGGGEFHGRGMSSSSSWKH